MSYDFELTLINKTPDGTDENGNEIFKETTTTVLCKKKSIVRSEFYLAAKAELKPEISFVMHGYEYDEQEDVEFDGVRYSVLRTFGVGFEEIEIVCVGRAEAWEE